MTTHFVNLLEGLRRRAAGMASLVEDMVQEACESVIDVNEALAGRVIARDNDVDTEEVVVESEVIRLMALYQPVGSDLRLLCAVLKINNDLERIADCAVNVAERARHMERGSLARHRETISEMATLVRSMLRNAVRSFAVEDVEMARKAFAEDEHVDALYEQTIKRIVAEGATSSEGMAARLDVLSVAKNLERIADHATNIAEDVIFLSTGEIVRHGEGGPRTNRG
ncbi:MAG: phosphate signaling complex protein PhoU [Phycisphaerae bacterium]